MEDFFKHYYDMKPLIKSKLDEFQQINNKQELWLEEMVFCVFAANSSAEMGLKATNLVRPVLENGSFDQIKERVKGKVRFYNVRTKYLIKNRETLKLFPNIKSHLDSLDFYDRRLFIKNNFLGFGFKESSHFLRNIGYKGYGIIDKHVIRLMHELGVFEKNTPPKNEREYYDYEKKLHIFASENDLDVDALDLALWSYATGKIIK